MTTAPILRPDGRIDRHELPRPGLKRSEATRQVLNDIDKAVLEYQRASTSIDR